MLALDNMEGKFISKLENFKYLVPDMNKEADYWNNVFACISNNVHLVFPIDKGETHIDKFTGYYGYRWHPVKKQSNYFHSGIDINSKIGTDVKAIADGVFEYSGYHPINGNYILDYHRFDITD